MKEKRFFLPSQCKHSRILKKILKLKVKCLEISLENYWDSSWQKTILAKRKGRFACVICFFIGKTGFSWKKCVLICTFVYLDNEYGNMEMISKTSIYDLTPLKAILFHFDDSEISCNFSQNWLSYIKPNISYCKENFSSEKIFNVKNYSEYV